MYLLPYQERVLVERDELSDKVVKLGAFLQGSIFRTVTPEEKERLEKQYSYMKLYLDILDQRVDAF